MRSTWGHTQTLWGGHRLHFLCWIEYCNCKFPWPFVVVELCDCMLSIDVVVISECCPHNGLFFVLQGSQIGWLRCFYHVGYKWSFNCYAQMEQLMNLLPNLTCCRRPSWQYIAPARVKRTELALALSSLLSTWRELKCGCMTMTMRISILCWK